MGETWYLGSQHSPSAVLLLAPIPTADIFVLWDELGMVCISLLSKAQCFQPPYWLLFSFLPLVELGGRVPQDRDLWRVLGDQHDWI